MLPVNCGLQHVCLIQNDTPHVLQQVVATDIARSLGSFIEHRFDVPSWRAYLFEIATAWADHQMVVKGKFEHDPAWTVCALCRQNPAFMLSTCQHHCICKQLMFKPAHAHQTGIIGRLAKQTSSARLADLIKSPAGIRVTSHLNPNATVFFGVLVLGGSSGSTCGLSTATSC